MRAAILGFAAALTFASSPSSAGVYFAQQASMAGPLTAIHVTNTATWSFTAASDWVFGGASLMMKLGSRTTESVALSLYGGDSRSGPALASVHLTRADFCGQSTNCQQFSEIDFMFQAPVTLLANETYFLDLTSPAPEAGQQQYFLKGGAGDLAFLDSSGSAVPAAILLTSAEGGVAVPAPSAFALLGTAVLGMAALVSNRRRRTAVTQ